MKLNKLNKVTAIFPKSVFPVQHRKYVYHHRIPHIQISLCTKFYLNKQIWIFDPKLFGIEYFQSKLDKVNIAVKFNISELNSLPISAYTDNCDKKSNLHNFQINYY